MNVFLVSGYNCPQDVSAISVSSPRCFAVCVLPGDEQVKSLASWLRCLPPGGLC